ncbi:MAG TPA: ABC transporter substrate-binding protein [Trebonia sp.]|jgi:peptide/nickel transport system substrate-binding protein
MASELGRRRFLGVGAALAGTGLLSACGAGNMAVSLTAAAGQPKAGGSIVYLAQTLIPGYQQQNTGSWSVEEIWDQFVELLFYPDSKGNIRPHLATGYTANADLTNYTIGVREGVTFSNGEKLDAEAVALNLNVLGLGQSDQGVPRNGSFPPGYSKAVATGDYTVEVAFSEPFNGFVQQGLTTATSGILAPATLKLGLAEQSDLNNVYGTGPWTVQSWSPSKEIVLTRRDDYNWPRPDDTHTGPAYLEQITVQQITETALRDEALQSGEAHIAHYPQTSQEDELKSAGLAVYDPPILASVWGLHIRLNARFTNDIRVREALTRAVNRQQILDTNYDSAWKLPYGPLDRTIPHTPDLSARFAYDPDRASSLLDEAGWTGRDSDGYRTKNGQTLEFPEYPSVYIQTSQDDLTLMAQQYQEVGIKLTLENVDFDDYPTVTAPNLSPPVPLYEIHWTAPWPSLLWRWWHSSQENQFGAPSKELDTILENIVTSTTTADAYAWSVKAQQYVIDNYYFIPVHEFTENWAAVKSLGGVTVDGGGRIRLYNAWLGQA